MTDIKEVIVKPIVYILELERSKYYVGITLNLNMRLGQHYNDDGSKWTKQYKPVRLVEVVYPANPLTEKNKTLEYMRKYGWENVRGYAWCQLEMKNPPIELKVEELVIEDQ